MSNETQCREEFSEAFNSRCGSCRAKCACGVEWFDDFNNGISWDDGEFELLVRRSIADPEKCRPAGGAVSWMEIDGKIIVWGCSCTIAKNYDRFIIQHAPQLADYLRRRAKRLKCEAEKLAMEAAGVPSPSHLKVQA